MSKPARCGTFCCLHIIRERLVHVGARHLARHLALRIIGKGRGRHDRPARRFRAAGRCPPRSAWSRPCGRHGPAACRSSPPSWRGRNRRCASTRLPASSLYRPVQPGVMRASAETSVISVKMRPAPPMARLPRCTRCQSFGTPSVAEYWHIGETTTRLASVMPRSWNGWNIGGTGERVSTSKPCRPARRRPRHGRPRRRIRARAARGCRR